MTIIPYYCEDYPENPDESDASVVPSASKPTKKAVSSAAPSSDSNAADKPAPPPKLQNSSKSSNSI